MTLEDIIPQGQNISIKMVWIRAIDRCQQALAELTKQTDHAQHYGEQFGVLLFTDAVKALMLSLVDFGDAPIKTEVFKRKKAIKFEETDDITEDNLKYYKITYSIIIEVLNKYGMLYDVTPDGYSNCTITSITEEEYNNADKTTVFPVKQSELKKIKEYMQKGGTDDVVEFIQKLIDEGEEAVEELRTIKEKVKL